LTDPLKKSPENETAATLGGSMAALPPLALDGSSTVTAAPRAARWAAELNDDAHGTARHITNALLSFPMRLE
jgi:hypothetical protein